MDTKEKMLQNYIASVMAMKDKMADRLSENDLNELGQDLGLSPEELKAIDAEWDQRFTRGKNFQKHDRIDDAIRELSDALALKPLNLQTNFLLADLHHIRWIAQNKKDDRQKAEVYARACLNIDPAFEEAYRLLNSLENTQSLNLIQQKQAKKGVWIMAGVLLLALIVVLALVFPNSSPPDPSLIPDRPVTPDEPVTIPTQPENPENKELIRGLYRDDNTKELLIFRPNGGGFDVFYSNGSKPFEQLNVVEYQPATSFFSVTFAKDANKVYRLSGTGYPSEVEFAFICNNPDGSTQNFYKLRRDDDLNVDFEKLRGL